MTDPQRPSPVRSDRSADSGHGWGLNLVILGLGIVMIALGYGLVSRWLVADPVEAEVAPVAQFELTPTPELTAAPVPTEIPSPSPTQAPAVEIPTPTAIPTPAEAVDPSSDAADQYRDTIYRIAIELPESFDRFIELLSRAEFGDTDWQDEVEREFALWLSVHGEVAELEVPERHRESHSSLLEGTARFADSVDHFRSGFGGNDPIAIANGFQLVGEAVVYLNQAAIQLEFER